MDRSNKDMSLSAVYDGNVLTDKTVKTIGNIDVDIACIQRDKNKKSIFNRRAYGSEFIVSNCNYSS
mgnify:CR=1 FL=1